MRINAYYGDEEFELIVNSMDQIGKKITIIEDKNIRTFTIIDIETVFSQDTYDFPDIRGKKICNITKIKIYLEEDEIH